MVNIPIVGAMIGRNGATGGWVVAAIISLVVAGPGATHAASYEAAVRETPGLLAYYRLDDADETARDSSPGARHGKYVGTIERRVDSAYAGLGKAARLNTGGHVRLPELGEHNAVSVELWLRLAEPVPGEIAAIYAADSWQPAFLHFNVRSSGALEWAINGVAPFPNSEPGTVKPGKWTYLVGTYDRATGAQRLFRDGRLVLDAPASSTPAAKLVAAAVGAWYQTGPERPLVADIDELALYSTALTPAQVRAHYLAGKGVEVRPVDFAREVRPLLAEHCFKCHGPEKQKAQLRLDVREGAFRGGESGEPAVTPFAAERSHLIQLISETDEALRMPPEKAPLNSVQIALLTDWIDQGANWPDELAGELPTEHVQTTHWSFQPMQRAMPPASDDPFAAGNPIDRFVITKLREHGLTPSPPADRRTLLRRLRFDLHGLPPTPAEIAAFESDTSPDAWQRCVDEALASPRYGERWASHWLDVIRYGDTHGFEVNTPRENAWPFRDWVINSLNADKPYNEFIAEQVAGDQLGANAATGFLMAAPALLAGQTGKDLPSIRLARADELHEMIVSVGSGVLGLTVGCARCHNHKFDPVSQRDYYQFQAIFAGVKYGDRPLPKAEQTQLGNSKMATAIYGGTFISQPEATQRLYRGDPMQRRERVAPDVPAVFGSLHLNASAPEAERRRALAKWLVEPTNPLTARVLVNRVWQHHFGAGLVATPSDFGALGVKPTHPELLDYLAVTFVERGWSLKQLHRLILTSSTYCQSSRPRAEALVVDAGAQYLWRFPPQRLEMEALRDSILATSGALNLSMGGPGFQVFQPNANYVRVYDPKEAWTPAEWRRMVYVHRVRMAQDGVFGAFDCPDAGQPAPRRSRSTTAIQALNLLNSTFLNQQAEILARRVEHEAGAGRSDQVGRAFLLAFSRPPSESERVGGEALVGEHGLPALCRALFNSNEFLFVP